MLEFGLVAVGMKDAIKARRFGFDTQLLDRSYTPCRHLIIIRPQPMGYPNSE